jgi:antitoxin (DNA-binding transcriptional repressor) of toxin-antitoxin stability system
MKRLTPTQARRNWFRLLDEVAAGEVVLIERRGRRIVLKAEESAAADDAPAGVDYRSILNVPDLDRADEWGWEWVGPGELAEREGHED